AEDGIRDFHVTGVQTCALPIFLLRRPTTRGGARLRPRCRGCPDSGVAPRRRKSAAARCGSVGAETNPCEPASSMGLTPPTGARQDRTSVVEGSGAGRVGPAVPQ